jgi:hypothetical protein
MREFGSDDLEAFFLESSNYATHKPPLDRVGFENY